MSLSNILPTEGVTLPIFQEWKRLLIENLQNNSAYKIFLPGGLYSTWLPKSEAENGLRIEKLHIDDSISNLYENLLMQRNKELDEMMNLINIQSNNIGKKAITEQSTSFDTILQNIIDFHNLEHKPTNILDVTNVMYTENEDFYAYYTKVRDVISNCLKKKGCKLKYFNNKVLEEDEMISPTFEEVIILWCLEKIDHKLPLEVNKCFGHILFGETTLIDLQQEIFEHIPTLLQIAQVSSQIENENISFKEECKIESENYEKYSNNEFESNIDIDIKDSDCSLIDKFSCDTCDESFDTKFKLRKHKKIHQSKIKKSFKSNGTQLKQEKFIKDMQCSECDVYLPSKQSWQNHIKTHSDNLDNYNITSYSDDNSNKDSPFDFDSKMQIENNAQMTECNEEKNPHLCINCGKDFTTKKCLNLHKKKRICAKTESISCEICGKSFSHEGHLAVHSKIHLVDSNGINCKLCGKFVTDVEGHKMECRGEKFMCSECGNSYANKSSLRNHMKKHQATETGKTWTCDICGKTFNIETNLRAHMKIHTDTVLRKILQCQTCKRKFCHEREMGAHVCKHHSCSACDLKFFKYKNFKNHQRMHAGETVFPCGQCEGIYMNRKMLNAHKRIAHKEHTKKYKCEECPKAFTSTKSLYYHKLVHSGERPYSCEICGAAFRQKAARDGHYKVHTNERPYPCSGCDLKFKTLGQVKRHREVKMCGFNEEELFKTKIAAETG